MSDNQTRSDLIDRVHHEHEHLCRLFDDLHERFEKIAAGEFEDQSRDEIVEMAAEDLAVALDEMLHHFNQEEEIFFVDIETRFPELGAEVARLVEAHETMCERTRWLQQQFKKNAATLAVNVEPILEVLRGMKELVRQHTVEEQKLFDVVLSRIPPAERIILLREMQSI
ncbi:MAG: hemerythrin domain-containing protein [Bradymonadaceae bacterium]|nr:hemerythrin domain-containing protein [Lujinxingiaceae bacterium]